MHLLNFSGKLSQARFNFTTSAGDKYLYIVTSPHWSHPRGKSVLCVFSLYNLLDNEQSKYCIKRSILILMIAGQQIGPRASMTNTGVWRHGMQGMMIGICRRLAVQISEIWHIQEYNRTTVPTETHRSATCKPAAKLTKAF